MDLSPSQHYIVKPASYEQLLEFARLFKAYWLSFNRSPVTTGPLMQIWVFFLDGSARDGRFPGVCKCDR
jgi:hypothetical protein